MAMIMVIIIITYIFQLQEFASFPPDSVCVLYNGDNEQEYHITCSHWHHPDCNIASIRPQGIWIVQPKRPIVLGNYLQCDDNNDIDIDNDIIDNDDKCQFISYNP